MIPHCSCTEMDNSSSKLLPNLLSRTLHWWHQSTDSRTFLNVFSRTRTLEITTCFACWVNYAELFFLFLIKFETFCFGTQIISTFIAQCISEVSTVVNCFHWTLTVEFLVSNYMFGKHLLVFFLSNTEKRFTDSNSMSSNPRPNSLFQ